MPDLIKLEQVSFTYTLAEPENKPALLNISFSIQAGESIALIGANGSGKSTLAKLLNALLLPDSGRVLVSGMDTRERSRQMEIRSQVGLVFQRPQHQIVATTIEEEVAFGPGNLGLPAIEVRERVADALQRTGLDGYRQRPTFQLSAGETQRLALAGILAMQPRCVIFDETTAMLDPQGREMVLRQIAELRKQGIATILITHLMQEAAQAERVIVLFKGEVILDDSPDEVFSGKHNLKALGLDLPPLVYAGDLLRKYIPEIPDNPFRINDLFNSIPKYTGSCSHFDLNAQNIDQNAETCIQIRNLAFTYMRGSPLAHQALKHIDMEVGSGSVQGLIGCTGSGKSTILQHINGLYRPQSGSVQVGEFNLSDKTLDVRALRRKAALAFQQPEDQIFEQYVGDEIAYAPRRLGYSGSLAEIVEKSMRAVGLDFRTYKDRLTSSLSGGEKRKVALASILAVQAEIFLLDEPLSGLDPQAADELLRTLKQLHQKGRTLLISTHQYEEVIPLMENVTVIQQGRDTLHGGTEYIFSQTHALEQNGLKTPLAARIAQQLREKGWPIREQSISFASLEEQLAACPGADKR